MVDNTCRFDKNNLCDGVSASPNFAVGAKMKSRKKGLDRVLPWANMSVLSVVIYASLVIQGVKAGRRK